MVQIYINTKHAEEKRLIITSDNRLVGYEQEIIGEEDQRGSIYKGRVEHIVDSLNAAFIDLGNNKTGFLPLASIPPALLGEEETLKENDFVLVQILNDRTDDQQKSAKLTANISLPGAFLVLLPHKKRNTASISRQSDGATRSSMAELISSLELDDKMSIILRTAGLERSKEELEWDLNGYLLKQWDAIGQAYKSAAGACLLYTESTLMRVVRDYLHSPDNQVVCDEAATFEQLQAITAQFFPDHVGQVRLHDHASEMVASHIEQQIDQIYDRTITMPNGGSIVFDHTEALVAVDVNSGQMSKGANIEETALAANLAAAECIALQLRLRNIGGLVVVDFIDMQNRSHNQRLEKHFVRLLRQDRARIRWSRISEFGLVELSRQRISQSLVTAQKSTCHHCRGTGLVERPYLFAIRLLRKIHLHARQGNTLSLAVQTPVAIAVYLLNEKRDNLRQIEEQTQCRLTIIPNPNLQPPNYEIKTIRGNQEVAASYDRIAEQELPVDKELAAHTQKNFRPRPAAASASTTFPKTAAPGRSWLSKIASWFKWGRSDSDKASARTTQSRGQQRHKKHGGRDGGRGRGAQDRQRGESNRRGGNRNLRRDGRDGRDGRDARDAKPQQQRGGGRNRPQNNRQQKPKSANAASSSTKPASETVATPPPAAIADQSKPSVPAPTPPPQSPIAAASKPKPPQNDDGWVTMPAADNDKPATGSKGANGNAKPAAEKPTVAKAAPPRPPSPPSNLVQVETAAGGDKPKSQASSPIVDKPKPSPAKPAADTTPAAAPPPPPPPANLVQVETRPD